MSEKKSPYEVTATALICEDQSMATRFLAAGAIQFLSARPPDQQEFTQAAVADALTKTLTVWVNAAIVVGAASSREEELDEPKTPPTEP